MRHAALIVALAGVAHADPKPEKIDLSGQLDKLEVYRDELGSYYVLPKDGAYEKTADADNALFYGDGKTLYQQRVMLSGGGNGKPRHWTVWAPRAAVSMAGAYIEAGDKPVLKCKPRDAAVHPLKQLPPDEARTLLAKAKVFEPLHQRLEHLLARDDEGTYYYVDELREGGKGFRLFVGQKGAMKELTLTNIVHDSAGEIFGTKNGLIKVTASKEPVTFWIKGDKKIELTTVELRKDQYLIYRELGIYGQLGSVCEDL